MIPPMDLKPATLHGEIVTLEPLTMDHLDGLAEASNHDEIWAFLDEETPGREGIAGLIAEALDEQAQGQRIPFAIIDRVTSKVIGSISFIDIHPKHRGVEIGWAWVTPGHWSTGAAREASQLLMAHAFDTGAIRVAFKTDSRNTRSQRAIEALGAQREGVFRNHRILRDGYVRHSIYYSVCATIKPDGFVDL
jgi:RimJ/RimL family protein N-acetyltransferase